MLDLSPTTWTVLGLLATVYFLPAYVRAVTSPIHKIPTIGPSGVITSYFGALRAMRYARDMIQEGYEKYNNGTFKVPMLARWIVVVTGPKLMDEVRRASDDELSFNEAIADTQQLKYTLGAAFEEDLYHVATVRTPLTRSLAARFPEVQDEIAAAFSDYVPAKEEEWLSLPAYSTIAEIVCRTSNRLFVGLPLCREPEYRKLNIQFTIDLFKASVTLGQLPKILRPIVARMMTGVQSQIDVGVRHLGPLIEERFERLEKFGLDDPDRPNDLISWLLDYASPERRTVRDLTIRILSINFAAIHTTTMGFTDALYDLAIHPEYAEPMRQEVLSVIATEGWTKTAMTRLRKVDSFIRESQRHAGTGALSMMRRAMKDFTFSDGTTVPKGYFVAVPSRATHMDESNYSNPHEFQGFRFADMREDEGESTKHQASTLGLDWVIFGGGRHACPGRFFALNEMKAMLAHVLLNYEVKLADGDRCHPEPMWFAAGRIPNRSAHVLFRKRKE